jgi:hypothetical protein
LKIKFIKKIKIKKEVHMKKIKNILFCIIISAIVIIPMLASAQVDFPEEGETNLVGTPIYDIVKNFMMWILGLVGIIGVISFAIAGVLYLTAAGDEDRINTAKKAMMYSIIGVIVALMGLVILNAVQGFLGANNQF